MVKRLRRNMDILDTMDDNTCLPAVHIVHIVHTVHSSLREQQLSTSDRLHLQTVYEKIGLVTISPAGFFV
ncbi:MAG: hypothetical protein GX945_02050 [Lentisphaerae bacterium]|nr:hypothetical protein [Lentisphaerota bacterium]